MKMRLPFFPLAVVSVLLASAAAYAAKLEKHQIAVTTNKTVWILSVRNNFESTERMAKMTGTTVDDVITETNAYLCETAMELFPASNSFALGSTAPGGRVIYFTSDKKSCKKLLKEQTGARGNIMRSVRVVRPIAELPKEVQTAIEQKLGR